MSRSTEMPSARERELQTEIQRLREANRRLQAEGEGLERDKIIERLTAELVESRQREGEKQAVINELNAELERRWARINGLEHTLKRTESAGNLRIDELLRMPFDAEIEREGLQLFRDPEDSEGDYVAFAVNRPSISGHGPTRTYALLHLAGAASLMLDAVERENAELKGRIGNALL